MLSSVVCNFLDDIDCDPGVAAALHLTEFCSFADAAVSFRPGILVRHCSLSLSLSLCWSAHSHDDHRRRASEALHLATESEAENEAALRRERCRGVVLLPLVPLVLYGGSPISDAHLPDSSRVLPLSLSLSLSLGMWHG